MFPPDTYVLANARVSVDILDPLIARDGTREGVADLLTRTAAAISIHLHSA